MSKKPSPFEHFNRIATSKKPPTPEELESYEPVVSENYYSNYKDTCLLAELHSMLNVPKHISETFFRGTVEPGRRKFFWPKASKNERIANLMKIFDCSHEKAAEIEMFIPNSTYIKLERTLKKK